MWPLSGEEKEKMSEERLQGGRATGMVETGRRRHV